MSVRWSLVLATCAALMLVGCSPQVQTSEAPTSTPTVAPTPSSTPAVQRRLDVTLDGVTYVHAGKEDEVAFSDTKGLISLFTTVTGVSPVATKVDDPPGYSFNLTSYAWDGVKISANDTNATISVTASALNGVPVQTEEKISVGSSRADVLTKQGWPVLDKNGDGIADELGIGRHEVAGTRSLAKPASTGIQYILLEMDGDTVRQIQSPSNDFSDI